MSYLDMVFLGHLLKVSRWWEKLFFYRIWEEIQKIEANEFHYQEQVHVYKVSDEDKVLNF